MRTDYIIVGQGLCGSFLSRALMNAGRQVLVIDEDRPFSSTKVASGVINPVTGRRLVKTWMIDELLPFAQQAYTAFGNELGATLAHECTIVHFHANPQMREAFDERQLECPEYLQQGDDLLLKQQFHFHYGLGMVQPSLMIDLHLMLQLWRARLREKGMLLDSHFNIDELVLADDVVRYKDITASAIIFCNGVDSYDLPFFQMLPSSLNKGEALIVRVDGLSSHQIYKHGLSIVPWDDGLFWVGSTYENRFTDAQPTSLFRKKTEAQLSQWLKLPYEVVDHIAAVRPATVERRPFVGMHPAYPRVGILNGMGTKGCSLAPYFAQQLTAHLVNGGAINPLADLQRFKRILTGRTA